MSTCYSNLPSPVQNHDIMIDEPSNDQKDLLSSHGFIENGSLPTLMSGKYEEDDTEDEESEFKMGRLIRQASLNSSHMSTPQQTTKVHIIFKYFLCCTVNIQVSLISILEYRKDVTALS
ncbi:hypothetical protein HanPI659440_Chr03g0119271 [Helianthus annuus]|nr:hypothetical protein HanPI659440_Chr03g0119271 [Helianthus annuus]